MEKRLLEIQKRRAELRMQIKDLTGEQLDAAIDEVEKMDVEEKELRKKAEVANKLNNGNLSGVIFEKPESRAAVKLEEMEVKELLAAPEYRSAYFKNLAGVVLSDTEKRTLTTAQSSAGAAIPTTTANKILEKLKEDSIVYGLVTVSNLRGNVVIPMEGVTGDVERKAEGQDGTVQNDTLASITLGAHKYIKLIKLTCELQATSIDALEDYIVTKLVAKMEEAVDHDIINGSGTDCAKGILTTLTPIETGEVDVLDYDDICDLFAALPAKGKKNATLMMSTTTLYKRVAKIKDEDKRPIFDITSGKVLGRLVTECDIVPDDVIIFGDFKEYQFNWNKDIEIARSSEAGFESGDVVFRSLALADGELANLGAMKALIVKEGSSS